VYTIKIDDKAHKVSIEVAMLLKAVSEERDELKDLAIWMTRCGYDFCQHGYFIAQREALLRY